MPEITTVTMHASLKCISTTKMFTHTHTHTKPHKYTHPQWEFQPITFMLHPCLYAWWLVMGRCPAVWVKVCHFPHKWKHLDIEVCPEVRAVEALTHKVAGRQPVEEMSSADCWRRRSVTHTHRRTSHTHTLHVWKHTRRWITHWWPPRPCPLPSHFSPASPAVFNLPCSSAMLRCHWQSDTASHWAALSWGGPLKMFTDLTANWHQCWHTCGTQSRIRNKTGPKLNHNLNWYFGQIFWHKSKPHPPAAAFSLTAFIFPSFCLTCCVHECFY